MNIASRPNTDKYRHVLRPLLAEEKDALRASLQADGLLSDLVIDQHADLLDGHSRYDLCLKLGIEPRFRQVTTDDPVGWIKAFQKARRNLNRDEMRALIAEQIVAAPHHSDRTVAKAVGWLPALSGPFVRIFRPKAKLKMCRDLDRMAEVLG